MKDFSEAIVDARAFDAELISDFQGAVAHTTTVATQKARSDHAWKDITFGTRDSIKGSVSDRFAGAVGTIVAGENAVRMNDGTRAHRIEPRHKKFLRFQQGGATVFSRGVNHPGTKGDHFLDAAAEAAGEELVTSVKHVMDDALG